VPSLVECCVETLLIHPEALTDEAMGRAELSPFLEVLATGDYGLLEGMRRKGADEPPQDVEKVRATQTEKGQTPCVMVSAAQASACRRWSRLVLVVCITPVFMRSAIRGRKRRCRRPWCRSVW
jgi:hypothetical protein